jgi:hypothetical protein
MIRVFFKLNNCLFIAVPILCVAGAVLLFYGGLGNHPRAMQIGTGLFLSGVSALMFGKGLNALLIVVEASHLGGFSIIKERKLYIGAWVVGMLVLMALAVWLFCMVVRGYFLAK